MAKGNNIGKALVLLTQLSINMLVPIFLGLFIGAKLDRVFQTNWLSLIFIILGVLASIKAMFVTLKPLLKGEREKKDEAYQKQFDERHK